MSEQVLTTFSLCYNRRWETPHPLSLLPQKNGCPVRLIGRSLTFLSTVLLHVGKVYKRLRSQIKSTGNGPAHTGDGGSVSHCNPSCRLSCSGLLLFNSSAN
ncbi:hypothetical protein ILYODFUR_005281 [Ilyodon furcidens]|uniref:Uncharacterized protein n=1 Tax=Ilyodon furcidens TaxID=33524 RepID=A0ABV0SUC7_9TELE